MPQVARPATPKPVSRQTVNAKAKKLYSKEAVRRLLREVESGRDELTD